jgi:hypothetical protein
MTKRLLFTFATAGLASALAASSYRVTLFSEGTLGGQTVKPGDYKLELKDNSAVLKKDKQVIEAPARTEEGEHKFNTTTVRYNDQHMLEQIRIGGTKKIVVFGSEAASGSAVKQTIK